MFEKNTLSKWSTKIQQNRIKIYYIRNAISWRTKTNRLIFYSVRPPHHSSSARINICFYTKEHNTSVSDISGNYIHVTNPIKVYFYRISHMYIIPTYVTHRCVMFFSIKANIDSRWWRVMRWSNRIKYEPICFCSSRDGISNVIDFNSVLLNFGWPLT